MKLILQRDIEIYGRKMTVYSDGRVWKHKFAGSDGRKIKGQWVAFHKKDGGYLISRIRDGKKLRHISQHRLLAECFLDNPEGKGDVDHIDGNKTNNCLENLRWATRSENLRAFRRKTKGCHSIFRGVSWYKNSRMWAARLKINGKNIHIGCFDDEEKAARAFDAVAIANGYALEALNFPEDYE